MLKFRIYKDSKGEYRWRLVAANNEIIASGEGYKRLLDCKETIDLIRLNASKAIIDETISQES